MHTHTQSIVSMSSMHESDGLYCRRVVERWKTHTCRSSVQAEPRTHGWPTSETTWNTDGDNKHQRQLWTQCMAAGAHSPVVQRRMKIVHATLGQRTQRTQNAIRDALGPKRRPLEPIKHSHCRAAAEVLGGGGGGCS